MALKLTNDADGAVALKGDTGGAQKSDTHLGDHASTDPDIQVGGVQEQVRDQVSSIRRCRNSCTVSSISEQIRDTVDLEIPVSLPSARTSWSTLRVLTPSIQAWQITA